MLGLLGRLVLLRLLPRRLMPILTLYEVYRLARGLRSGSRATSPAGARAAGTPVKGPRVVGSGVLEGRARVE